VLWLTDGAPAEVAWRTAGVQLMTMLLFGAFGTTMRERDDADASADPRSAGDPGRFDPLGLLDEALADPFGGDEDGDQQFTIEDDEDNAVILECDPYHWVGQAFDAYSKWRKGQDALDLKPEQTYKRAQGERRPSER